MGTLFNNIILTCDFAHNVQCGKGSQKGSASQDQNRIVPDQTRGPSRPQYQQLPQPWQQPPEPTSAPQPEPQQPSMNIMRPSTPSYSNSNSNSNRPQGSYSPASPASNSDDDDGESGRDYESNEPLIPATIPPRSGSMHRSVSMPQVLPYKAPPAPVIENTQTQQHPPRRTANHYRQLQPNPFPGPPADRSQLVDATSALYDGASSVTPSYAEQASAPTKASIAGEQQSSFNVVIDHVAPQHQSQAYKVKQSQQHHQNQVNYKQSASNQQVNQLAPKVPNNKKHHQGANTSQHLQQVNNKQTRPRPQQAPQPRPSNSNRQKQHVTLPNQQLKQQPQTWSMPLKPVHVVAVSNGDSNKQGSRSDTNNGRPALIDLTNDKQIGVSSDAINNGLLLIVRHGHSPASSTRSTQFLAPPSGTNQVNGYSAKENQQAFVVDPKMIRPDSVIDAQLFPNVQKALASAQKTTHSSPNHVIGAQQSQGSRVHPPLPPMEPPKPQNLIESTSHVEHKEPINLIASGVAHPSQSSFETSLRHQATSNNQRGSDNEHIYADKSNPQASISSPPARLQTKKLKAVRAPEKQAS